MGGYAGTFVGSAGGMPELLRAQGGVCTNFWGLKGGYAGAFVASGGYAGTFVGSEGGMTELLWASGGYAGTFVGLGGVCRNFWGLWKGILEIFGA